MPFGENITPLGLYQEESEKKKNKQVVYITETSRGEIGWLSSDLLILRHEDYWIAPDAFGGLISLGADFVD